MCEKPVDRSLRDVTETTTIRIPVETKDRLTAHKNGDQSIGDVVTWLAAAMPTSTEIDRERARLAAILRTNLVRDFGDKDELTPGHELWNELAHLQYPSDPDTTAPTAVILDHTALSLLAGGNRLLAQLVHAQPHHHQRRIFAPTQAIYTATIQHSGLADHLDRLGVIEPVEFGLDATLAVGKRIHAGATPAVVHVVHAAQPSAAWPTGRPVITVADVATIYHSYRLQLRTITSAA